MKGKMITQFSGLVLGLSFAFPAYVPAAAPNAPRVNNPICTVDSAQSNPVAVSHSSGGGAVIAWQDRRNGNSDIYAQRLCGCDTMDWSITGVPVCTANGDQLNPVIVRDSSEGAIIAWQDKRNGNYDIFVQKVNAWGEVQWTANGVPLCVSSFDQRNPAIVGDSAGGAIVTWEDTRGGTDLPDIYAQRIDENGVVKWGTNGIAVCVQAADQLGPQVICNVKGGAIVSWQDKRSGDYDIYAQRINASGTALWDKNGMSICSASKDQLRPRMIGDGSSGAIIVWQDFRSTIDYNIFAQRIGADGAAKWAADGLVMNNNTSGDQLNPVMVTDGSGGAIIAWEDKHGGNFDICGQRVNSSGGIQWASIGVSICTATGDQLDPQIVTVYSGGANVAWVDHRNAISNIYAQQVTADGVLRSGVSGMPVSTADGDQSNPGIISNGNDGAIVTWQDLRNANSDNGVSPSFR